MEATVTAATVKPLLRGWTHLVSFPLMVVFGTLLIVALTPPAGRVPVAVYVGGTAVMFGVSALYHRVRWQPRARALMQKFDHSAIYLAIAGGYTPVAVVCLEGWWRLGMLLAAWIGAAVGILLHWLPHVPRAVRAASYIALGWVAVLAVPQMNWVLGPAGIVLILLGGVAYTVGAACFATKRPDPWPSVFGYHEVFHAFTVLAATLQFVGIAVAVVPHF
ncbi:MAG TPA: hemolysin III family protein [Ilumatobacteraceae bacterium]|nr:hemolysin III family protein [Ilumatobacteraceae bacterium]